MKRTYAATFTLIFCLLSFAVYGEDPFRTLVAALEKKAPQIEIENLVEKYRDKRMGGRAYVVSFTRDISDSLIVTLSTTKDPGSSEAVNVIVFLRKYFSKKKLKFERGQRVRFFGSFKGIQMKTIIIEKGMVRLSF